MLRNYLIVAFRALTKSKTYAFINLFGLAIGLAASLMILLYVRYETSYDSGMPGADRAFQLQDFYHATAGGGENMATQMTSYVSGKALAKDFPQIEKSVYVGAVGGVVLQNGVPSDVGSLLYADGNLFDILQIPFVRGDRRTALDRPNGLVLTETEAARRFPHQDPLGRVVTLVSMGRTMDYVVTGVVRDLPKNSHLALDMVARYDPQAFYADFPAILTGWGNQQGWVYVKLRPGADAAEINRQIPAWKKRNIPDETHDGQKMNPGSMQDWRLTNVRDIHLGEAQRNSMTPGNDRRTVATFAIIAFLILGMAVVNFTNLATARASKRAREVALRKVLGASRAQLIVQFIGESVLLTTAAMLIALALVELLLPSFNRFLDADIALSYGGEGGIVLPVLLLTLVTGTAAGLYPALILSRFRPAMILKANQSAPETEGTGRLRNLLVVGQFAVSIALMSCTTVIYAQTVHARTADPGYRREGLLQIGNLGAPEVRPLLSTLKQEVSKTDGVQAAALTGIPVDPRNNSVDSVYLSGNPTPVELGTYGVDTDFFPTMGMKLLAGRDFSQSVALDDATRPVPQQADAEEAFVRRGVNVVVSALAAERLGFRNPADAIGKQVKAGLTASRYGLVPATIVGVVGDARFRSIRDPLQPIMFYHASTFQKALMVRYVGTNPGGVLRAVERVWKRLVPGVPFDGEFVEDRLHKLYDHEEARAAMFAGFSVLAVLIGCLGLFGLAAFTTERRTKEIGIRKVFGARVRDIVRLLAWQFSKPVILANLIAWPVAWWLMRDWLNKFDSRIALTPGPFLFAGLLALAIAVGTVATHAIRVARLNPIHALRYE
jgi:putative ABC transport system permease protein